MEQTTAMLTLKEVSKIFRTKDGEVRALHKVNLELSSGEFLVIKGPSGCGKTTLLLIAGCLLQPTSGQLILNDLDPYNLSSGKVNQLRSNTIGFVFQQYHLIPYLSVRDNILLPILASKIQKVTDRVDELIHHFGLEERAGHLPYQLSTGEKQRTALARALFNKPQFILADEPTGNLDEENAAIIYSYLKQYVSEGGSTLLVSHDSMACDYGTKVLSMSNGKIQ